LAIPESDLFRAPHLVPYSVKKWAYLLLSKPFFPLLEKLLGGGWSEVLFLVIFRFVEPTEVSAEAPTLGALYVPFLIL
jgi:hypothetical protein